MLSRAAPMGAILIIDRDAGVQASAQRVLHRAGFSVVALPDDADLPEAAPLLVIADLAVASLAGLRRTYPATPILALFAEAAPGDIASLEKPFTESRLLAAVRRCLAAR
jgi:DNA-binding response OmpR family regulator